MSAHSQSSQTSIRQVERLSYGCLLLLFVASLRSVYFTGVGASIDNLALPLLQLLLFITLGRVRRDRLAVFYFSLFVAIIIAWTVGVLNMLSSGTAPRYDTALAFAVIPVYVLVLGACVFDPAVHWRRVFATLVLVHVLVFFLQLGLYYGFGVRFDPIEIITGNTSRNLMPIVAGGFGYIEIFRSSGLFDEPGTYASFVAVFIGLLYVYDGYRISRIVLLGLSSLLLSFSAAGVAAVGFIVLHSVFRVRHSFIKRFWVLVALTLTSVFAFYYVAWRFAEGDDSSFNARLSSFAFITDQLFGIGFVEPVAGTLEWGVFGYLFQYFGVFSLPLLGCFLSCFWIFPAYRVPLLLLFVSKISISSPIFWMILSLCFIRYGIGRAAPHVVSNTLR